jgi:hypothetical protein
MPLTALAGLAVSPTAEAALHALGTTAKNPKKAKNTPQTHVK